MAANEPESGKLNVHKTLDVETLKTRFNKKESKTKTIELWSKREKTNGRPEHTDSDEAGKQMSRKHRLKTNVKPL